MIRRTGEIGKYSQVAPHNRVAFTSAAEAENMGYRLAGNCPSGVPRAAVGMVGSDRDRTESYETFIS